MINKVVFAIGHLLALLYSTSAEECLLDQATERIQIAFVADVTNTTKPWMANVFPDLFKKFIVSLNDIHPGTEVALTGFANWPSAAFVKAETLEKHKHVEEFPEKCYINFQPFTSDADVLKKVALTTPVRNGRPVEGKGESLDVPENSLQAVSFALTDTKLGWAKGTHDSTGRRVHRFVIVVADSYTLFELPFPGDRKPFRGDGTDNCTASLPAKEQKVAETIVGSDAKVIGIYVKDDDTKYIDQYVQFFKTHDIQHCHTKLKPYSQGYDINTAHEKVLSAVSSCVKSQLKCEYLDPPSYNMLGL